MKPKIFIYLFITGVVLMMMTSLTQQDEKFYYAFDKKIPLVTKNNTLLIKFKHTEITGREKAKILLTSLAPEAKIKWHNPLLAEVVCRSEQIKEELKSKLEQKDEVITCLPFYTSIDGFDMGVTNEILVLFLPGVTTEEQIQLHKRFKTKVIKTTKVYQKLETSKGDDALEIANQYYETGLVKFAHPNFISYPKFNQVIPNDTYFNNQITCHNTGQTFTDGHSGTNDADIDAPEAWGITTGCSDIVVAVLDQGVTSNHPDLPNTRQIRLNGSNFGDGNANDPSPTGNDNHGNACAGVIAATMNNNQGIAGIAANCRIMPIRIENAIVNSVADAIEFAVDSGANVLSNSWSYGNSEYPVITTAINYAVNNDRVVVFAAGNNADHDNDDNGYVEFPANVNISTVVTVGASDRNDNQANYSPTSSLLDIVAPSNRSMPWQDIAGETYEMWTIDIPDTAGYNVWHGPYTPPTLGEVLPATGTNHLAYTARFGGTSHACPVVAGVAALMLSVNPNLSNEDVYDILTFQARKVGGFTYTNGRCNEMGYGRVDAYAAVYYALDMNISGSSPICMAGTYTVNNLLPGATIEWTKSSNLTRVSAQGANPCTFSVNGSGAGWVGATINRSGGSINLPHKSIWLGVPDYNLLDAYDSWGQKILVACDYTSAEADYDGTAGIDAYEWDIPNANNWDIEEESGSGPDNKYVEIEYWEDPAPYQEDIYIRAHNSCGWSNWKRTIWSVDDNCGWLLMFSPNPTTGETTLSIESESEEKTFDETAEWNLEIYSESQLLKEKKTSLRGQSTKIQTAGWKEGVYMVRVKYKDEILTGKLVVKK